ncbi:glycoside hydrolase family 97 protein [Lutibacter sp.]|uniref:glycoside hydrolase family 97 protein n=1 Tax=Lutibacter sp. TaxID=1925666 RepID=UPI00356A60C7
MKKRILALLLLIFVVKPIFSQEYEVKSPNEELTLNVNVARGISWYVSLKGEIVIEKAEIGIDFLSVKDYGFNSKIKKHTIEKISNIIYSGVSHKDSKINDVYVELILTTKDNSKIKFRVYNDGVAYQFLDKFKGKRKIVNEQMSLTFPKGTSSLFPQEESMYSHNERTYLNKPLETISKNDFCSLPVLFNTGNAKVVFTETALHNYPGMFVKGNNNLSTDVVFPKYPLKIIPDKEMPDRNQTITEKANYIAVISGSLTTPWRVFVISDDDRILVESNLTYQLAKPQAIENSKWIKPGKVAWDWYNANNITGVDFKSGLNTATYKYYIDFASENNIEYVILDEGWTKSTTEILEFNPDMDVAELIRYGKEKGVELILWVLWKPLDENMHTILETYKNWGVKGVKVDFMQRNDQYMVESYERIAKKCAEFELLVDFHGSFKPSGLRRMYPNVVNYEGVKGSENNKWSADASPKHNVTIPFIRMVAGPMDYTPGAMSNAHLENHLISFERPMSVGTRAHQVAMYVVYEAPLQMMCESPSRYYKEQETVDFIVKIPTTWDETEVLHGAVGDYIAVARRKNSSWFIGAMTDKSRELDIDLSFLDKGEYIMKVYKDGINANRFAEDYLIEEIEVNRNSKVAAKMVSGGGWTAIISKK